MGSADTSQALISRIWNREVSIWSEDPAVQSAISHRLGWLDSPSWLTENADRLSHWASDLRARGFAEAVLIGMGGSSLAAEVLSEVAGSQSDGLSLTVLDTTHPESIHAALANRAWARMLFLVASKSGTTIEVQSLCAWVLDNLEQQGVTEPGAQCVAITDPSSPLSQFAVQNRFIDCIENPENIGGRFSALTAFGMVPAALMDLQIDALAQNAVRMAAQCRRVEVEKNPGFALGRWIATQWQEGRDCLQFLIDERYAAFGAWAEQLIAESLGKNGKGVLPLDRAMPAAPSGRLARVVLGASDDASFWQRARDLNDGAAVFEIPLEGPADIAGEFFRWSFATAVAGALMQINPFDEPDVAASKTITQSILDTGGLDTEPHLLSLAELAGTLNDAPANSYLAILNYMPADPVVSDALEEFAQQVRERFALPVTINTGPRYLHSTGQFHKGGPGRGIFFFVRGEPEFDLDIFSEDFGFAGLNQAQAMGDCSELSRRGRRISWVNLEGSRFEKIQKLRAVLRECVEG